MSKITFLRVHENGKTTSYTFSKKVLLLFCLYNILLPILCVFMLFQYFSKSSEHYALQEEYAKQSHSLAIMRSDLQKISNYIAYLEESGNENLADTLRKNAPPSILEAGTSTFANVEESAESSLQEESPFDDSEEEAPLQSTSENEQVLANTEEAIESQEVEDEQTNSALEEENAQTTEVPTSANNAKLEQELAENSNSHDSSLDLDAFNAAEEALPITEEEVEKEEVIFEPINKNIVEPRSINASIASNGEAVDVQFAIYNISGKAVAGDCTFTLFKNGKPGDTRQLIKEADKDTAFSIKNMKNIKTTLKPHRDLISESDSIKLDIYVGEELVYSQIIPLA